MAKQDETLDKMIPGELMDKLVEALVSVAPAEAKAPALKARVMARIKGKKLFDSLTIRAEEGEWITLLPGVEKKILSEDRQGNVQSYLLRMAPGSYLPPHRHLGDEECIVLEGELSIGKKIHLKAGDYHFAPKGSFHGKATTKTGGIAFLRTYEAFD